MSEAVEFQTVDEKRNRMESLFEKHAFENEETADGTEEPTEATIIDFDVEELIGFQKGGLLVSLYFALDNNTTAVASFEHLPKNPSQTLWDLLDDTHASHISDLLDKKLSIQTIEEGAAWKSKKYEFKLSKKTLPELDIDERFESEKLFDDQNSVIRSYYEEQQSQPTKGTASIVDYYVRESAPEITQKLEIGLKFELPTGETKWYEIIHDATHPDEGLERLIGIAGNNIENLYELIQLEVPVKQDPETEVWHFYPARTGETFFWKKLNAIGLVSKYRSDSYPIEKTYKHGKPQSSNFQYPLASEDYLKKKHKHGNPPEKWD